jgi:4-hydroxy-tetrahydrodipicolinate synthase
MYWPQLISAIPTPFNEDCSIDYDSLKNLIKTQIEANVGVVLFGTTGECVTLNDKEKEEIMRFVIHNYGTHSFVIGIGGNNTNECITFMKLASLYGFTRFMGTTPYYNKPTQAGLCAHFLEIEKNMIDSTELILYNVPGRTGVNLLPETIKKIVENSNGKIIGVKEASGNLSQMIKIKELLPNFLLFCGDDGLLIPALSIGAYGLISVIANVYPNEFKQIIDMYNRRIHVTFPEYLKYNSFIELLFKETSPSPVKSALVMKNIFKSDTVRLPLVRTSDELKTQLESFITKH